MNVEPPKKIAGAPRRKRKYRIVRDPSPAVVRNVATAKPVEPAPLDPAEDGRFSKSRHELIAEVAYYKAERRGFEGGDPDRDWHEAEKEVEEWLRKNRPF